MWHEVRVQTEVFDLGQEEQRFRTHSGDSGAVVAFMGLVREFDLHNHAVTSLYLEHFPELTEQSMLDIIKQAQNRWPLSAVQIIHRVGQLNAQEPIVLVLVACAHRRAAFDAAQFVMDVLKSQALLWKREHFSDGTSQWVDVKPSDTEAAASWRNPT